MFKHLFIPLLIGCLPFIGFTQDQTRLAYIEKYKDLAIKEMERAGIPASIKLAQGILESNSGQSYLARKGNNHFGMKCGSNWDGKKVYRKDDDYGKDGKLVKSCFRAFRNAETSYIAHSDFLRDPNHRYRYGFLFYLDPFDYKQWAVGLKKSGYATSASYHKNLISIIEGYQLYQYDQMSSIDLITVDVKARALTNNDVKYVFAEEQESAAAIASRTGIDVKRLLKYNEKLSNADQKLEKEVKVYLQPKRNSFRGKKKWHYVQDGETMFDISQMYAIKLKTLYKRNRMPTNTEPAVGERIRIRGRAKVRPRLSAEGEAPPPDMPELIFDETEEGEMEMEDFDDDFPPPEVPEETIEVEPVQPEIPETPDPPVEVKPVDPTPEPETKPDTPETSELGVIYHTIKKGDTLYNIARKYITTVDAIKRLNNLDSNLIRPGEKLRVR